MSTATDFYEHLFADATRAGVHHLPQGNSEPLIAGAQAAGCCVFAVDLSAVSTKNALLDAIAKALAFPSWFGANWDALSDSLLDMGWRPALGYLVILQHADRIHALAEDDFLTLTQIFNEAADAWREDGVPFWCLVDMLADGLAWLPTMDQPMP